MSGGTWTAQNKVRPGAYINFQSVDREAFPIGDRGIGAIPLPLSWGAQDAIITVYSDELLSGDSESKVGFTAFDVESKLLNGMLSYCHTAQVFRLDAGGTSAKNTTDELTITAKYNGTFGNEIIITIDDRGELFVVNTYVRGMLRDSQTVAAIEELEPNNYVTFSGTGAPTPTSNAGLKLSGGTNGTLATSYADCFKLLKTARWQTFAAPTNNATLKQETYDFIEEQRERQGRYVQAVVVDYDAANYEGIINSVSGCVIGGVVFNKEDFVAIVAGMTAGARINESNTGRLIKNATNIIGELGHDEIVEGLRSGKFMLSPNQSGTIKIEQDINSLHTFTTERNYSFSKNRVIRVLDETGIRIRDLWEQSYLGKVGNDKNGRAMFKADMLSLGTTLENMGAIQEFEGAADINVLQGESIDSVYAEWWIWPTDSMEKLYMKVNVMGRRG